MSCCKIIKRPKRGMLVEILENDKKIDSGIVKKIQWPNHCQMRRYKEMTIVSHEFSPSDTIGFARVDGIWRNLFEDAIFGRAFNPCLSYTFVAKS